jgi:hypothetical protein
MYLRNTEPTIDEMLRDEVVRLVMARDGLSEAAVRALIRDTRQRLQPRWAEPLRLVGFDA